MKFEVNKSTSGVNFLDSAVSLKDRKLKSNLYSKPTDAFLYLNKTSSHPKHVTNNIPKGQFIRIRRICSDKQDYHSNCDRLCSFFVKRGYDIKFLRRVVQDVSKIDRALLLQDKKKEDAKKDPQMIFVCEWHPILAAVPSILKKHFPILQNDTRTSGIFPSNPMVAYRRPKCIKNFVVNNKSASRKSHRTTEKCGHCKLCPQIRTTETITNPQKNITIEIKDGGTCRSKNVIYAAICKKCDLIYIGQTGDPLNERFSKHRYDAKKRPNNNELAEHFHQHDHSFDKDLEVLILQSGLSKSRAQREHFEDRWICRLQTRQKTGINQDIKQYARDMYMPFSKISATDR